MDCTVTGTTVPSTDVTVPSDRACIVLVRTESEQRFFSLLSTDWVSVFAAVEVDVEPGNERHSAGRSGRLVGRSCKPVHGDTKLPSDLTDKRMSFPSDAAMPKKAPGGLT
ncbi:hypothetical protein ABIB29_001235 [Arthrobacter sp. UYEF36]